jgi:ubiquinone/menaquinone biosynthesis C-methylase UbiE
MKKMNKPDLPVATYEEVAAEYYDPVRHPTCANFSELSTAFLHPRIRKYAAAGGNILEVGAGRSTVAPILPEQGVLLTRLTLLDQSARMLAYSRDWEQKGARLLLGNACHTHLPEQSFRLVASALGDPYNCSAFWREVARLLEPGGVCLFTTPAWEWATRFRPSEGEAHAEFVVAGGRTILVPSKIPTPEQQALMIAEAGLQSIDHEGLSAEKLSGPHSPKLLLDAATMRLPIVCGFTVRRI